MYKLTRIILAVLIIAVLSLTVPAIPAQAAGYCYFADSGQSLGSATSRVAALGDIDGDGDLDAFIANSGANKVWWNNGSGTFTDSGQSLGSGNSLDVALGDLDGDGDLDAFIANSTAAMVNKVWLNNGSGTFSDSGQSLGSSSSMGVALGDLDGDGDLDAFVANITTANKVWLNNGSGTFSDSTQSLGSALSLGVALGDVDGDGDLDAFIANSTANKVWLNNGSGTFTDSGQSLGSANSENVALGDLDGDGDLDAFIANYSSGNKVWLNNGSGTFTDSGQSLGSANSENVALGDLDGDGDLDAFVSNWTSQANKVWRNNGSGTFSDSGQSLGSSSSDGVALGDVDGDGDLDAFVANNGANKVWRNDIIHRSATFPAQSIIISAIIGPLYIYAADMDGDGDNDVLSCYSGSANIVWSENTAGDGSAWTNHTFTPSMAGAQTICAADVDGDGDTDMVLAFDAVIAYKIAWVENTAGDGSAWVEHAVSTAVVTPAQVSAADIDGDGDTDLMSASAGDDKIAWYENTAGDGSAWTARTVSTAADGAYSVHAADVDGDGDMDLMSASFEDDKIAWYENNGASPPSWTARTVSTAANWARSVYAADVDGDGDIDLMSASQNDDKIAWYENNGASPPSWTARTVSTAADWAWSVYAADVDGDGDIDLMSASFEDNKIAWYENNGASPPSWTARTVSTAANWARSVYAADVDGDGDIDLMSASKNDDKIAWYENNGASPPSWTARTVSTAANWARSVYAADVDGDGDIDLMSASNFDSKVAWYENKGGQFALATTNTAPTSLYQGQTDDLLKITATHKGRTGDADMELATFELLFEESSGDPLTTAEANALIENLHVYLDDGSDAFEAGSDTPVATVADLSLSAGTQTVTFIDGDAGVQVAYGTPKTYFVVAELTADAGTQTPNQFRITHLTESSSTAEDRNYDLPLTLEYVVNVPSGVMTASSPPPTISSFTPTTAATGASVTITGDNFTGATTVKFGGTDAASFTVDLATQITAVVGSGSSGKVSVTTPGGTATSIDDFTFDNAPPTDPTNVQSTSHTVSTWSGDNTIAVTWTDATDAGSGLDGYSILWDTGAATIPDTVKDIEEGVQAATSAALADGNSHYFHIRSVDNVGNWQPTAVHLGPFFIDTAQPADPTNVHSPSHAVNTRSGDNTIAVTWTDATDATSGLDGYSILWDTSATTIPDTVKDIEEGIQAATSPALADGNSHYFHIRSVDNAGNWQSAIHLGPFFIDTTPGDITPPTAPGNVQSTSHITGWWSDDNTIDVTWTDATDAGSGLDGYSILWDTSATTIPDAVKGIEEGVQATTSPVLFDGYSHYFHIRSVDNAGNWQSAVHLGPFFIDTTPTEPAEEPTSPTGPAPARPAPVPATAGDAFVSDNVSTTGVFTQTVTAPSADGKVRVIIKEGVRGLSAEGKRLSWITVRPAFYTPSPPAGAHIIGLCYRFQPSGATFSPPITITYTYDDSEIPAGIAEEDLVIALYDEENGKWVEYKSTVDPVTNTITIQVSHFSVYGILTYGIAPIGESAAPIQESSTPTPESANWGLIGGITGACIVVIVALLVVLGRRRSHRTV